MGGDVRGERRVLRGRGLSLIFVNSVRHESDRHRMCTKPENPSARFSKKIIEIM
jgi:hypothetical protein